MRRRDLSDVDRRHHEPTPHSHPGDDAAQQEHSAKTNRSRVKLAEAQKGLEMGLDNDIHTQLEPTANFTSTGTL